jgi:hypothetical protein
MYMVIDSRLNSLINFTLCDGTVLFAFLHHSIIHSSDTSLSLSTTALAVARLGRVLGAGAGLEVLAVFEALDAGLAAACRVSLHL